MSDFLKKNEGDSEFVRRVREEEERLRNVEK
jgi:hypothetical protein